MNRKPLSVFILSSLVACVGAQQPQTPSAVGTSSDAFGATWELGFVVSGGFAPNYQINSLLVYQEELQFYTAGLELGRTLTRLHGPGILQGRGEARVEVDPLWVNYEPQQSDRITNEGPNAFSEFAGYLSHGMEVTPLMYRWRFTRSNTSRFTPWLQTGAGLLWTSHRFPQGYVYAPGGNTSRINFTPQAGAGVSVRAGKNKLLNAGMRYVWVGSAGIGEYNPGVTALQFTAGLSWSTHRQR